MWVPKPQSAAKSGSRTPTGEKNTSEDIAVAAHTQLNSTGKQERKASTTLLANREAMRFFVQPFEVTSRLTGHVFQCRFSHMWNGIATRHADTIDTKFFVDSVAVVLGLAHTAFVVFRDRTGRDLSDRESSFIAADFLRERLEEDDERPLFDVSHDDVLRVIQQVGIK